MRVKDDQSAQAGISSVLLGNYPRMTDEQLSELLRLLGNSEADDVVAALDAHILSEDGRFPPQAGQILEQMRRKAEREKPDPFKRDPERVREDVRTGAVSIDGALRDYGVTVDLDKGIAVRA